MISVPISFTYFLLQILEIIHGKMKDRNETGLTDIKYIYFLGIKPKSNLWYPMFSLRNTHAETHVHTHNRILSWTENKLQIDSLNENTVVRILAL